VDFTDGGVLPPEVRDALLDPRVIKRAYNAAFERCATLKLLGLNTPVQGWRCTMALAYSKSFQGGLEDVGKQIGLEEYALKDDKGRKLVKLFCMPQKPNRKQPHVWCNRDTHPYSWSEFLAYNRQDVIAEMKIADWLLRFPMQEEEWQLYEIDQVINDAGLPVDLRFITNGQKLAWRRKVELMDMMREAALFTEHQNPGSTKQLLPWLKDRGYRFDDLQKNTIKKVLNENEYGETPGFLVDDAVHVLKLRQQANRTSVRKLDAMLSRVGEDNRLRHCFQFVGASRTGRWSKRLSKGCRTSPLHRARWVEFTEAQRKWRLKNPKKVRAQAKVASQVAAEIKRGTGSGLSRLDRKRLQLCREFLPECYPWYQEEIGEVTPANLDRVWADRKAIMARWKKARIAESLRRYNSGLSEQERSERDEKLEITRTHIDHTVRKKRHQEAFAQYRKTGSYSS
jgi:hypothetical protein